jgi:hypothetical protein
MISPLLIASSAMRTIWPAFCPNVVDDAGQEAGKEEGEEDHYF